MGEMISSLGSGISNLFSGGAQGASNAAAWGTGYGTELAPAFTKAASPSIFGNLSSFALPAASLGMSYYQGKQGEKRANEFNQNLLNAANQNQKTWQQNAYPQAGAVNAMNTQLRGNLGQARLQSTQNMSNQLAARGIGAGSGYMAQRQGDIESAYLKGLGSGLTDIQKFANTAQFAPPSSSYYTPTASAAGGTETMAGQASSLFDTYYGYQQMQKLIQDIIGAGGK